MTTLWQPGTTIARRVRVQGGGLDPTLTQLRLASLLYATDMQPAGLAPSAIVCIRSLRTTRHLPLSLQHGGVRPPHAWEQSVNATLQELTRRAARPILGPVPANSAAIIFDDTAELLACMAADWCQGLLPIHWWWKSLFKTNDVTSLLFPTWLSAPAYAPAALQHLAVRNLAIPFVRSLSNNNSHLLLEKILHTFSLPTLLQIVAGASFSASITATHTATVVDNDDIGDGRAQRGHDGRAEAGLNDGLLHSASISAPWHSIVPEAERNELGSVYGPYHSQKYLLGIGLMLHRAPATVRTMAFVQVVQEWLHEVSISRTNTHDASQASLVTSKPLSQALSSPLIEVVHDEARTLDAPLVEETPNAELLSYKHAPTAPVTHFNRDDEDETFTAPFDEQEPAGIALAATDDSLLTPSPSVDAPPNEPQLLEEPLAIHIDTAFGGVFYLINLALFLNFYSDFTAPMSPNLELSIWDFLALLAQHMHGDAVKQDPVWPLLAHLAERNEHDEPGKGVPARRRDDGAEEGASWLSVIGIDAIYTRLQLALGVDAPELVGPLLCIHQAQVRVTATHLDVFFSLNTLPIEIRLAGLDRDPGWVPAAGRFIAFHFS